MKLRPHVLIIGTNPQGMGGVAAVFQTYRDGGLGNLWPYDHLITHCDGSAMTKLSTFLRALLRFHLLMLCGRGRILHIHTSSRFSFIRKSVFVWLGRLWGRRVLLHLHGAEFMLFYRRECGPLIQAWIRATFRAANTTVVLSSQWQELAREFAPETRLRVIHNPILLPAEAPEPGCRQPGVLLFLGRIGERKGAWDLLDVMVQLAPTHPELRLWMGGDGQLDEARVRIHRLGLEGRVELLGWLRGSDKQERLRRASIYVLPSYNEGLPMGVLEAMAWSLPVLSTDVGGTRDAIPDDSCGLLIHPGDTEALRDSLRRLLADSELRDRLGRAARERIATTFSPAHIFDQLNLCYQELCGGTP